MRCTDHTGNRKMTYRSQTTGLDSFRIGANEEQGCRGGGATGILESKELAFL